MRAHAPAQAREGRAPRGLVERQDLVAQEGGRVGLVQPARFVGHRRDQNQTTERTCAGRAPTAHAGRRPMRAHARASRVHAGMRARRHARRAQRRCSANTARLSPARQDVHLRRRDGMRAFGALKCPFGINAMAHARQCTVSNLVPLFLALASAPLLQSRVVRCQPCAPLSTLARSAQRRCHRQQWHASDHQRSLRSSRAAALP